MKILYYVTFILLMQVVALRASGPNLAYSESLYPRRLLESSSNTTDQGYDVNVGCGSDQTGCKDNQYCNTETGQCAPCWEACLHCLGPEDPSCTRCHCNYHEPCTSPSDCGDGTFCGTATPSSDNSTDTAAASCQPCYYCFALSQQCAPQCGDAPRELYWRYDLPFDISSEQSTRWAVDAMLYSRSIIQQVTNSSSNTTLLMKDAAALLQLLGVEDAQGRSQWVLQQMDRDGDGTANTGELTRALHVVPPVQLFCGLAPEAAIDSPVFPGCPCLIGSSGEAGSGSSSLANSTATNATEGLVAGSCPAGQRCSPTAYQLLNYMHLDVKGSSYGLCVPCLLGEYCPIGTAEQSADEVAACGHSLQLDMMEGLTQVLGGQQSAHQRCSAISMCPAGKVCRKPSEIRDCEAGSFCPVGSIEEQTCQLKEAIEQLPFEPLEEPVQPLIEKLFKSRKPIGGNYCPGNASTPLLDCPAGYYCPQSDVKKPCPPGRYCPVNSEAPKRCLPLHSCSSGREPQLSSSGLVMLMVVIAMVPIMLLVYRLRIAVNQVRQRRNDNLFEFIGSLGFSLSVQPEKTLRGTAGWQMGPKPVMSERGRRLGRLETVVDRSYLRPEAWWQIWSRMLQRICQDVAATMANRAERTSRDLSTGARETLQQLMFVASWLRHCLPLLLQVLWLRLRLWASRSVLAWPWAALRACREGAQADGSLGYGDVCTQHTRFACPVCCEAAAEVCNSRRPSVGAKVYMSLQVEERVGSTTVFRIQEDERISVEFKSLTLRLRSGPTVLCSVSGSFNHSQTHAIMGPSGCGKSTFLATLCGRSSYATRSGQVWMYRGGPCTGTGQPLKFEQLQFNVGFVPQNDIVHEDLTVRENLEYSAWLRLPASWDWNQRQEVVRQLLSLLGLNHIQHSVVGSVERRGISGGQRKRVSIGLELAARPSLLFLDEPTSGLDSTLSQDLVARLSGMAVDGMTVVTTIHQPRYSIFLMFDTVLLLGVGGHTVYLGHSQCALEYFSRLGFFLPVGENPADFLLDVLSGGVHRNQRGGCVDHDFVPRKLFSIWRQVVLLGGVSRLPARETVPPEELIQGNGQPGGLALIGGPQLALLGAAIGNDHKRSISAVPKPCHLQAMLDKFDDLDKDGSGTITEDELEEFWGVLRLAVDDEQYETFLTTFLPFLQRDSSCKDKPTTYISKEGFASWIKQRLMPAADAPEADGPAHPRDDQETLKTRFRHLFKQAKGGPAPQPISWLAQRSAHAAAGALESEVMRLQAELADSSATAHGLVSFHKPLEIIDAIEYEAPPPTPMDSKHATPVGSRRNSASQYNSGSNALRKHSRFGFGYGSALATLTNSLHAALGSSPPGSPVSSSNRSPATPSTPRGRLTPRPPRIVPQLIDHGQAPGARHHLQPSAADGTAAVVEAGGHLQYLPLLASGSGRSFSRPRQRNAVTDASASPLGKASSVRTDAVETAPSPEPTPQETPSPQPTPSPTSPTHFGSLAAAAAAAHGHDDRPASTSPADSLVYPMLHPPTEGSLLETVLSLTEGFAPEPVSKPPPSLPAVPRGRAVQRTSTMANMNPSPSPTRAGVPSSPSRSPPPTPRDRRRASPSIMSRADSSGLQGANSPQSRRSSSRAPVTFSNSDLLALGDDCDDGDDAGGHRETSPRESSVLRDCSSNDGSPRESLSPERSRRTQSESMQGRADKPRWWKPLRWSQSGLSDSNGDDDELRPSPSVMSLQPTRARRNSAGVPGIDSPRAGSKLVQRSLTAELPELYPELAVGSREPSLSRMDRSRANSITARAPRNRRMSGVAGDDSTAVRRLLFQVMDHLGAAVPQLGGLQGEGGPLPPGGRQLPNTLLQCLTVVLRCASKWLNDVRARMIDLLLIFTLAVTLGAIQGFPDRIDKVPGNAIMATLAHGLLSSVAGLRTFSADAIIHLQRESPAGLSVLAYFLGKQVWDVLELALRPAVFLGLYYYMTSPQADFSWYYLIMLLVTWYAHGIAYVFSLLAEQQSATLAVCAFALVYGGIINGLSPSLASIRQGSPALQVLVGLSYTRWAVEGITILEVAALPQYKILNGAGVLAKLGYCGLERKVSFSTDVNLANAFAASAASQQTNGTSTFDPAQPYCPGVPPPPSQNFLAAAPPASSWNDTAGSAWSNITSGGWGRANLTSTAGWANGTYTIPSVTASNATGCFPNYNSYLLNSDPCYLANDSPTLTDPQVRGMVRLYCYYKRPEQLLHDCQDAFSMDLQALFYIGLVARVLTLLIFSWKLATRAQK